MTLVMMRIYTRIIFIYYDLKNLERNISLRNEIKNT